jgi:serine/threonine-protein phosphatase 2A regulatory subunit B'
LWHNEYVSGLIAEHKAEVLPLIYPVLHLNTQSHWNPTVGNLTLNVLKIFMELDSALVEECSKAFVDAQPKKETERAERLEVWQQLEGDKEGTQETGDTA